MSNDLKDCPFCGSKPTLEDHRLLYSVDCKCGACVLGDKAAEPDGSESIAFWADIQQSAINKWNARSTPAVASGALPELPEPLEINWPTLNPHALGCGVEDRGLHDRYECAEYGWQDGFDMTASCVPDAIYDAAQMRAYGQACAAAAAPNAALVAALEALEDVGALEDGLLGDDPKVVKAQKMARAALAQAGEAAK